MEVDRGGGDRPEAMEAEPSKQEAPVIKEEPVEAAEEPGEEDPVVHEIPVYLSKGIPKLYLFQYPVRPAHMPYDGVEVAKARVRPANKQVELELKINTANPNYDRSKGEQIALNVDGPGTVGGGPARADRPRTFQSAVMDQQVLVGASAAARTGRYAVGVLNDNELHLTALEGVLSLRPSLGYLDRSDTRARAEGRAAADPDDPVDGTAGEVKAEAVTVKFARGDPEKNKKYKEKSYEHHQKMQAEEAWVEANFHQMKGTTWDAESQRMFCPQQQEGEVAAMEMEPEQYLLSLKDGKGS